MEEGSCAPSRSLGQYRLIKDARTRRPGQFSGAPSSNLLAVVHLKPRQDIPNVATSRKEASNVPSIFLCESIMLPT